MLLLGDQSEDILVHQSVGYANPLPTELSALAPYESVPEFILYVPVDLVAYLEYAGPVPYDHGLLEIGLSCPPAHVNPDVVETLVNLLLQSADVDVALRGDRDELVRQLGTEFVGEPCVDKVDLVHDGERGDIDPAPQEYVDELLVGYVLPYDYPALLKP